MVAVTRTEGSERQKPGVRGGIRYLRSEVETLEKSGRVRPAVGIRHVCRFEVLWLHLLLLLAVQVAQTEVDLGAQMKVLQRDTKLSLLAVRGHEGCRASRRCIQARR